MICASERQGTHDEVKAIFSAERNPRGKAGGIRSEARTRRQTENNRGVLRETKGARREIRNARERESPTSSRDHPRAQDSPGGINGVIEREREDGQTDGRTHE